MADFLKILAGTGAYIIGLFGSMILQYIMPDLIDLLSEWTAVQGIMWLGTILVWVIFMAILPVGVMVWGLTTKSEEINPFFSAIIGVFWAIFTIFITYFLYQAGWPSTVAEIWLYPLLTVLYWVGLTMLFIMNVGVIPFYLIIEAKKDRG